MLFVEAAVGHHEISLVVVRRLVQIPVGLEEARAEESLARRRVRYGELDVRLVEVAKLGRERVAYVLVRDDHVGRQGVAALYLKSACVERGYHLILVRALRLPAYGEDVYAHHVAFEEFGDGVELLRVLVE